MDTIEIAATGMFAQQVAVDIIANNLANLNTTGFKRRETEFQNLLVLDLARGELVSPTTDSAVPAGVESGYGVELAGISRIHEQGNLKATGKIALDAIGKVSLKSTDDVVMEGMNVHAKGMTEIVLEASAGIKIVCGASVITLGPAGVTIDGPLVKVNCGGGGGSAGSAESAADAAPPNPANTSTNAEQAAFAHPDHIGFWLFLNSVIVAIPSHCY